MEKFWYYVENGAKQGPITAEELKTRADHNQLSPTDLVWKPGLLEWCPAGMVQGLFGVTAPLPPNMPPLPPPDLSRFSAPPGEFYGAPPRADYDPNLRFILPVGRSGYAIAAGYLGLCSVVFFPAPFAILFGVLALNDIKRDPKKLGKGRAIFGIVMGALFSLPLAAFIIGMLTGQIR